MVIRRPFSFASALVGTAFVGAAACGGGSSGVHGVVVDPGQDASLVGEGGSSGATPAGDAGDAAANFDAGTFPNGFVPPLGAWFEGANLHFRARSANATRLEVSLFDSATSVVAKRTLVLTRAAGGDTWDGAIARVDAGITRADVVYYGYRAWGPNWTYDPSWTPGSTAGFVSDVDANGNRFNPNKLLIDPYARELSRDPAEPGSVDSSVYAVGTANRTKDSAPLAPKSMLLPAYVLDSGPAPTGARKDDIVYEVHLRGFTKGDAQAGACAGTYAGAAAKAAYLSALGVTALELLPIQETQNDMNDVAETTSGDNYWGYSTLGYFAPDRRYACDKTAGGPTRELAALVKAMHGAGIKVLLDVVYNHSAEGGGASLLSLRGMDNASYYELSNDAQTYVDDTGVGANMATANGITRQLVVDSLTYFTKAFGVDGFRFDLAAVVGNSCTAGCYTFDPSAKGVLAQVHTQLPATTLIAEPWGVGAGTYQLGNFPLGWSEWNGQFRDTVRAHQNQQGVSPVTPMALAAAISGSPSLFGDDGRGPMGALNYIVSHDGFTMRDLYSCAAKNNTQAWPYGPSDGGDDQNRSWDHHGDDTLQRRAVQTGLALLMTSAGVPMITGGDELYRTLQCNNNAYNLDSSANWLDWTAVTREADLLTFTQRLFAFRRAHPAFRPPAFWLGTDADANGVKDVTWYGADGTEADATYLGAAANAYLGFRLDGAASSDPSPTIFVAYDGASTAAHATLPANSPGRQWYCAGDTSRATSAFAAPGTEALATNGWDLAARGLAIFIEK